MKRSTNRWGILARGASAFALSIVTATPAMAQTANDPEASTQAEVVVTGSHITSAGFDAPTPTTVVGEAELRQGGRTDIAATLADLPQFRLTQSATSTNSFLESGQSPADLRGLGDARTLVLVNGRRYVSSNDLQTVPYSLVKNIDVVTGGASAAYGSGAVAGVVNIILDDQREGFELGAQTGISSRGDGQKYLFEGSAGVKFANDRGHFMIGGDYLKDEGVIPGTSRPRIGAAGFFPGADGLLYPTMNLHDSRRDATGLINTGILAGQTFNNDGTLRPFQYGILRPGAPALMQGGEGYNIDQFRSLSAPIERANIFARASFQVTDNVKVWAEVGYNRVWNKRVFFPDIGINQIDISASNPYLNQNIRDQLVAAGESGFTMGRVLSDMALVHYDYTRETLQGSVGLDGSFANDKWRYSLYYSHGEQKQNMTLTNLTLYQNFFDAVDAVRDPVSNQIVCRVALINPNTPCRPLNLFGSGNADPAAIAYTTADSNTKSRAWLDSAGASISGELFRLWNEPVSIAAGFEYREEAFDALYDRNSLAYNFSTINGDNISKIGNNVKEGYVEVSIPLLVNAPIAKKLSFNGAARVSDYSTSGSIWSWKVGGVWQINDDIKLRATRSRDIRAASIGELFSTRSPFYTTVVDISLPSQPITPIIQYEGGNPKLKPEIADTFTAGAVLTPRFAPGFALSVDYYNISVKNVISVLTTQEIVNSCYNQGDQNACAQIVRGSAGTISTINASYINIAKFKTTGLDFEASYHTRLSAIGLPGQLRVRALANYVDRMETSNGGPAVNGAGYLGNQASFLIPKWRANFSTTYESKGFGSDVRVRYVDGGGYAPQDVLANIGDNHISSRTYVDIDLRAYVPMGDNKRFTIYGGGQNLFDRQPPVAAAASPYFDLIGRYFTFGVRANF